MVTSMLKEPLPNLTVLLPLHVIKFPALFMSWVVKVLTKTEEIMLSVVLLPAGWVPVVLCSFYIRREHIP
jgi:hypothetical protein